MRRNRIEVGDTVRVAWIKHNREALVGTVEHVPDSTERSWIINGKEGVIHYLHDYEDMMLVSKCRSNQ